MGPLRVHPSNNRWFQNTSTGKGVYLTGSSTWNVLISSPGPTTDYNYMNFLNFMEERGHNYTRLRTNPDANLAGGATSKYVRSNQCCALDGGNKWDLTKWNQSYFDKLQDIVEDAQAKDIYVGILFFDGWWINQDNPNNNNDEADIRWESHPFNPANNIHSQTAGTTIYNIHTLSAPSYSVTRQKDFITKVINTVDSYDNVVYEIVNEDLNGTLAWQEELVSHVRSRTSKPVGITARTSDNNNELWNSSANWTSPDYYEADNYRTDPPHDNHGKVIIADTDHFWGIGGDAFWVWRTFTRGLNPIFMDPYVREGGVYGNQEDWEDLRYAMGATKKYADRVGDIADMRPDSGICSTTYCLVDPGENYIVYSHANSKFTVNMVAGTYRYEWYNIFDRELPNSETESVTLTVGNGLQTFDPPTNRAVLFIEKTGSSPTNTPAPTITPKPTNTPGATSTPTATPVPTPTLQYDLDNDDDVDSIDHANVMKNFPSQYSVFDYNKLTREFGAKQGTNSGKISISDVNAKNYDSANNRLPAHSIDGDIQTYWSGQNNGVWIEYNLGSVHTLNEIKIAFHRGNMRKATFEVQVSSDTVNWTSVVSRRDSSGTTLALESYPFLPVSAQYLRVNGYGNTENNWTALTEVEIYGQ